MRESRAEAVLADVIGIGVGSGSVRALGAASLHLLALLSALTDPLMLSKALHLPKL